MALLGPRQCGKSTLARAFAATQRGSLTYFDLEDPGDFEALTNPGLQMRESTGLIVIDEIQRAPHLFPILRVLADESRRQTGRSARRFLILGSASGQLISQAAESLAGRIAFLELSPFSSLEVGLQHIDRHWLRGGFPRSFLAKSDSESLSWRRNYVRTFLEQDLPQLGLRIPAVNLRRFWMMLAHYHGQIFNASELGQSLQLSHNTAKSYLDILTGTFMVRQLTPWVENIRKRQVKSSKIYFRDSGILHALLNISTRKDLLLHPKLGASWEGYALEEVLRAMRCEPESAFFWSVHGQAELDLLFMTGRKRFGFEFKFSDAPKLTSSMVMAKKTLGLSRLTVIYPGRNSYKLEHGIEAVPLRSFLSEERRSP